MLTISMILSVIVGVIASLSPAIGSPKLDPPIILADEPTSNLDFTTGNQIIDVFKDLNNLGKTIIIVTHNEDYRFISDYNINLIDGKLDLNKNLSLKEVNSN